MATGAEAWSAPGCGGLRVASPEPWNIPFAFIGCAGMVMMVAERLAAKEAERAHIFEKFFRSPSVGQRARAGLGLYLVSRIMDAHAERVEVDSRDGTGTCFTLVLPLIAVGRQDCEAAPSKEAVWRVFGIGTPHAALGPHWPPWRTWESDEGSGHSTRIEKSAPIPV